MPFSVPFSVSVVLSRDRQGCPGQIRAGERKGTKPEVARLKREEGRDTLVFGSADLAPIPGRLGASPPRCNSLPGLAI